MAGPATLPAHEDRILWCSVLGCERWELGTGRAPVPTPEQTEAYKALALRRLSGEPLQYLTGTQGFRNLELEVGPGVLVPRPETEIVVERCLELLSEVQKPKVIDVGTGSGAIALAIATERPESEVWAVESSEDALRWAKKNAAKVDARNLRLIHGDLFQPLPKQMAGAVDLVVSNPPYLSRSEIMESEPDVRDHEPFEATVGGACGLEIYPRLAAGSLRWLRPGGWLVLETCEGQSARLRSLLAARFTEVTFSRDLAGKLRVAEGRKL